MSRIGGALFLVAAVAFPFVFSPAWLVNIGVLTLMYAALATSWNLFSGYTGYITLGQVAFFGLGAYSLAITFEHFGIGNGYNPFYALPLVGAGMAFASLPVAWIALRTRAMTFAIVTLTLLFIVQQLAFNLHSVTHGSSGMMLPTPTTFGVSTYDRPFYFAMLGLLVVALLLCWVVLRSKLGLMLLGVREDEEKARGLGVRVTGAKLVAWWLHVFVTAMIGGVWAYYLTFIYPESSVAESELTVMEYQNQGDDGPHLVQGCNKRATYELNNMGEWVLNGPILEEPKHIKLPAPASDQQP